MAPRIRPHVQSKYCSLDPYSPLTLVVPEGLSPPWRDCFVDGQKDVLHGGALSKALVQNAKLKQCSRLALLFRMNANGNLYIFQVLPCNKIINDSRYTSVV